jgi:hypothetical protein
LPDTLTNRDAIFFGMWFSYAETLIDDITMLAALKVVDQNPLGSAQDTVAPSLLIVLYHQRIRLKL